MPPENWDTEQATVKSQVSSSSPLTFTAVSFFPCRYLARVSQRGSSSWWGNLTIFNGSLLPSIERLKWKHITHQTYSFFKLNDICCKFWRLHILNICFLCINIKTSDYALPCHRFFFIQVQANLGLLRVPCLEGCLVVGRSLCAHGHNIFHNIVAACSGFGMLGGRCGHVTTMSSTMLSQSRQHCRQQCMSSIWRALPYLAKRRVEWSIYILETRKIP